ncbi:N-glycosylation involved protein [Komagataella phaffii CBS 7435]|uniref:Protein involved in N-glycosylation n=2 Tax=Komagataella phaffii TaxID=460519 RepID=C4R6W7_KOMPG|nr:Protein involved in N-glycosylation [Komagataella phaffii GS115]AOA65045.1 GQ67_04424T0 [Komagataella phaffii]CAH2451314.1 N-glycosylation involved protein [Komagataella phaffii CBS 7435]AOA69918.1 GQ68_04396T0 [Komagataella phaffii GS115]CAY71342.1 Protein involved in N-glycosylation [Komagataella phaffii GS115]CCA41052.1 N-glycosylation involved protein [Komagataella phaffii CBS 7435]
MSFTPTEEPIPSYERSQLLHRTASSRRMARNSSHSLSNLNISKIVSEDIKKQQESLRIMGLAILSSRQHLALSFCKDIPLIIIAIDLYGCLKNCWTPRTHQHSITSAKSSEYVLGGIWCLVSGYLTYSILDGLMVRWIVTYSSWGAIVRMLSMSLLIVIVIQLLSIVCNPDGLYYLPAWVLISCLLTVIYIIQSYVTSNLRIKSHLEEPYAEGVISLPIIPRPDDKVKRTVDIYNIAVFAVVPIGIASFVTMVGLIRILLIMRFDVGSVTNTVSNIAIPQ